jgi:hypothetical protein
MDDASGGGVDAHALLFEFLEAAIHQVSMQRCGHSCVHSLLHF